MSPTVRTAEPANAAPELTMDELVALSLTVGELDVIGAYQALCGGSLLSWASKLGRGQS